MTIADTLLFLGLVALAYWLEEARLQLMAGVTGIAAGLTAAALAPSPWVGVATIGMGVYLVISAVRTMRAALRAGPEKAHADGEERR
jgi:hypothetical protein